MDVEIDHSGRKSPKTAELNLQGCLLGRKVLERRFEGGGLVGWPLKGRLQGDVGRRLEGGAAVVVGREMLFEGSRLGL